MMGFGSAMRLPGQGMYQPNQRVTVDLSNLMIKGVLFSQNVQKALGTIVPQVSTAPSAKCCAVGRTSPGKT